MKTSDILLHTLSDHKVKDQVSGVIVDGVNQVRIADEVGKLALQEARLDAAMLEVGNVRNFVGTPENILGSHLTKHGEIAEQVEVGIRRAKDCLNGRPMSATFEGVPRTGPTDYLINGQEVQSKFINGINNNLFHVLRHMEENPGYGQNNTFYHIPKDTHQDIIKIINGEKVEGLSQRSINRILRQVQEIEARSGKKFAEAVQPGISKYAEVQQGNIHETLNAHEKDLRMENEVKKTDIRYEHRPTQKEAAVSALASGAVGATISITSEFFKKAKEGKKFYRGDFSKKDWQDIGLVGLKGGAAGAVSGYSIYMLTNYASLSAPLAGAVVSTARGVKNLLVQHIRGEIGFDEFLELGMVVTAEAAIVGLSTAVGQALIPVPVLGSMIGSIAGSLLTNLVSKYSRETSTAIKKRLDDYLVKLEARYQATIDSITQHFSSLQKLADFAFDLGNNCQLRLQASYELALAYGVSANEAMRTIEDVDDFMLS